MKVPIIALAAASLLAQADVKAQSAVLPEKTALPPSPIVARASASAMWRIVYTYDVPTPDTHAKHPKDQSAIARNPNIQQIVVAKDGKTYHEEISYDNGSGTNIWWVNGTQVTQRSGEKNAIISLPGGADNFYADFGKCDFPDVQWVSASNYVGVDIINGVKCFSFRKKISLLSADLLQSLPPEQTLGNTVDATVWINVATRLPIQFAYKGQTETYLFGQAPPAALTVPAEVMQTIREYEATKARMLRLAPRP